MDAAAIDHHQVRGLALACAKGGQIRHIAGDVFLVPSQSRNAGGYAVDAVKGSCSCPSFSEHGLVCKHLWALRFHRSEILMPDVPPPPSALIARRTYSQNWPAYHLGQTQEKQQVRLLLRSLCAGIEEPPQERGRPRILLRDGVFAAGMKVYTTVSGRRASTDIRACKDDGLVERAASYNSVFRTIGRADLTPLIERLVEESARPVRVVEGPLAIDSTGLATSVYARWIDYRSGEEKRAQKFIRLHVMIGTRTNVITSARATQSFEGDAPMLPVLLAATAANEFRVGDVCADKAYLSNANLQAIEALGGKPWIPFKENSSPTGETEAWQRVYLLWQLKRAEAEEHYHQRSNVEATFSALKRKFGAFVRSKLPAAQVNEALLKCLMYNLTCLVHESFAIGIEPEFWMPRGAR